MKYIKFKEWVKNKNSDWINRSKTQPIRRRPDNLMFVSRVYSQKKD